MKKLQISVFLLLFQSALMIDDPPQRHLHMNNTHANCYQSYQFDIGNKHRPSSSSVLPIQQDAALYDDIQLARHHIIPYNILRNFYNRLATNEQHFRHFFHNVLEVAGTNAGVDLRSIEDLNYLRNTPLDELPVVLRNHIERNLSPDRQSNLARELYTWLPFNIFIGPEAGSRNDDPGPNFENNAHVIVGQLRLDQLRHIQAGMIAYSQGHNACPMNTINEMGDLVRLTPMPYAFNTLQWRYDLLNSRPYVIATEEIFFLFWYRTLRDDDFCPFGEFAFVRYFPPDFGGRSRRHAQKKKKCLSRDDGAVYDRYCINSLDVLSELIKENIVTLQDKKITFNSVAVPEGTKPKFPLSDCYPVRAAARGALTGSASAFFWCLLWGGAYIPFYGWAGCAAGSVFYGVGGIVVGTSLSLTHCV